MEPRQIRSQRLAQLWNAEVVRVEQLTRGDRVGAGLADELRRGLVGLADPERQYVAAADALVVQLADLRGGERAHRGARRKRVFGFHRVGYSRLAGKWGQNNVCRKPAFR